MATLSTQSFTTLVQNWAASVQSSAAALLDFTVGSVLRAIAEAQAGVTLWLQGLALQILATTRLATSSGADVDSFVADFGLTRIPAVPSSGQVAFTRATPTNAANIPVGALVQTADGTQTFTVIADTTNGAYSPALSAYVVNPNVGSVNVTVQAVVGGSAGNVSAATITVLQTGISGIDTVSNAAPYANGIDVESDTALRARFVAFINSLSKATDGAIAFAITTVQANLQYTINDNVDLNGTVDYGQVSVVIDDGSGATPGTTVTAVQNQMQTYRAASVRVAIYAATTLTANVVMPITTSAGYVHAVVVAQVKAAIIAYINALGLANTLPYTKLAQIAYDTSPGVTGVPIGYTLNGAGVDLVPTFAQTCKAGTVTIS